MIEPAYVYRARCDRVIDGDTYVLVIDLGFRVSVSFECRLHGIDVFEHNTPQGAAATAFARQILTGVPLVVQSYKDQRTFARWVCDVWVGGEPLADLLRSAGYEKR